MEMRHHSDCGLDICNVTKKRILPLTRTIPGNGKKRWEMAYIWNWTTHKTYTHTSLKRTLKDCKLKTPPTPPAVQRMNALKSVNCVAKWTSHLCFKEKSTSAHHHHSCTKLSFYFKLWTCHRKFTFNDFTFLSYRKLFYVFVDMLCLKLLNVTWMIVSFFFFVLF